MIWNSHFTNSSLLRPTHPNTRPISRQYKTSSKPSRWYQNDGPLRHLGLSKEVVSGVSVPTQSSKLMRFGVKNVYMGQYPWAPHPPPPPPHDYGWWWKKLYMYVYVCICIWLYLICIWLYLCMCMCMCICICMCICMCICYYVVLRSNSTT